MAGILTNKIRVAILDDHQSILDGYQFRLRQIPDIEVVDTSVTADEFESLLADRTPDVILLDVFVPISRENPNPFPILQSIPRWLQLYPRLSILVISMYGTRRLVKAVMEAGASGFILKNDQASIQELGSIIRSVAGGGIHFSKQAHQLLLKQDSESPLLTARQLQALSLCAAYPDATTEELAEKMDVANSTVRNLLSGAYLRLEVHTRTAAIAKARQLGLITPQGPDVQPDLN
ncbi:MAG: hypothetical protein A2Z16_13130 [Chloroflexi bacterium RBG_16_54_18]|nr:MAG: hypothetical protein A2Z16_13130 [Chloroflexi bacterium RBG_16_54_18]